MERVFSNDEIIRITKQANEIFNEIYFRTGKYDISYDDGIVLSSNSDYFDIILSEQDSIIFCVAVYLSICIEIQNSHPEIEFPIFIDEVFSDFDRYRTDKALNLLFTKLKFQVLFSYRRRDDDYLGLKKESYDRIGRIYYLVPNDDFTASNITTVL